MTSGERNGGKSYGPTGTRSKGRRGKVVATKAQQAARVRILAEAGFKATPEEIAAVERELRGE